MSFLLRRFKYRVIVLRSIRLLLRLRCNVVAGRRYLLPCRPSRRWPANYFTGPFLTREEKMMCTKTHGATPKQIFSYAHPSSRPSRQCHISASGDHPACRRCYWLELDIKGGKGRRAEPRVRHGHGEDILDLAYDHGQPRTGPSIPDYMPSVSRAWILLLGPSILDITIASISLQSSKSKFIKF